MPNLLNSKIIFYNYLHFKLIRINNSHLFTANIVVSNKWKGGIFTDKNIFLPKWECVCYLIQVKYTKYRLQMKDRCDQILKNTKTLNIFYHKNILWRTLAFFYFDYNVSLCFSGFLWIKVKEWYLSLLFIAV